ncbi:thiosulfate sulfurtransferase GlpE [bacterium MnTg03]|jgi:rhodanese-related sulfurtransferase|nr:thiosulfate sulfurtransferase GlpE [bacterium MnTg03]
MFTQITEFSANHTLLVGGFVALLIAVFINEFKQAAKNFSSLTPAGAIQLMNNEDAVLLDVREPAETVVGKIAKAIQIPVGSVGQRVGELDKHKDKNIIVYCKTGARAGIACQELNKAGFEKVYSLSGGMTAWQEAHLPVSRK